MVKRNWKKILPPPNPSTIKDSGLTKIKGNIANPRVMKRSITLPLFPHTSAKKWRIPTLTTQKKVRRTITRKRLENKATLPTLVKLETNRVAPVAILIPDKITTATRKIHGLSSLARLSPLPGWAIKS